MPALVRVARFEDLPALREVEREAGQRYRDFGLDHVADDEPAPIEVLASYVSGGRAWIAVNPDNDAVGYILVDDVDGNAHIEQVSVLPAHQGQGVGRTLIDEAARWALSRAKAALTLTTYGHIPWNRPLYEHLGFRVPGEDELGPGLRDVRDSEAAHGLDPVLRVVMRRELGSIADSPSRAGVQVRMARREDVGAVAEVYLRSRHASVPAIPPIVHDDEDVRDWFASFVFVQQEPWIAEDGAGDVVGLLVLAGDVVEQLYIDPGHTGAGVGSKLLAVAKSLRPRGLQLWTFQSNEGAQRFYERHGFTAVERSGGSSNEELAPDVRYVWTSGGARTAP